MTIEFIHKPVMAKSVLKYLCTSPGKVMVDATAGGGGHLALLAEALGTSGHVYAFDRDLRAHQEDAAALVKKKFDKTITLIHEPFSQVKPVLANLSVDKVDGLLCDLGVSSNQLDDAARGFSFNLEGPLDMRMDNTKGQSAYEWLASSSEKEIADAIYNFGGERKSRSIASLIKKSWPIENSTIEFSKLVLKAMRQKKWSKAHPATRTFQAIRIAVNHELDQLKTLLDDLPYLLALNGSAVFLSFHSLEDRMIKHAFRKLAHKDYVTEHGAKFELLTKKPVVADDEELQDNRRARSAKLRAIKRVL